MAEQEKTKFSPPALGGSSLLVAFAVLCLTVFALLSLSTVRADGRLGDAAAKAVEEYYRADGEAQEILARIRGGETPQGVVFQDGVYSFACEISQEQRLEVQVEVKGESFTVLKWQAVPSGNWKPSDNAELMEME